jgi:3-mercaptopyruvate sulfurtransferase SseA
MRRAVFVLTASLLAGAMSGCSGKTTSDRDLQLVDVADAINIVEGRKKLFGLAGEARGVFVDPRNEKVFREGHIPGAVSLPFQYVSQRSDPLKAYDVLVVYGNDYDDEVADGMSKRLMELGFRDVRTLRGGIRAWQAAGNDLDTGMSP